MADLAATYYTQGRYDKDKEISVKVLDLRREVLGEKHPDTISSIADLAATYYSQGRYDAAEVLYNTALDLRRHILSEDHPHTAQSTMYLASTRESLQQMRSRDSEEPKLRHRFFRELAQAMSFGKGRSH
ncbi:kinesin light chain [Emericellopsis atlantica]|uniref:Kinesin light chain n=1 Tax=Emericellopsis atlantica TaxID=2614577 RepID=A0A9P8CN93_9HYPO|nr:kinesin light chain [Emericellopsis atlantica]KAG9252912.1 kinesin light chain [Emericellopsis atlantica]